MARAQSTPRRFPAEPRAAAGWRLALVVGVVGIVAACATGRGDGDPQDGDASADGSGQGAGAGIVTRDLAARARDELAVLSQPAGIATLESPAAAGASEPEPVDASIPVPVRAAIDRPGVAVGTAPAPVSEAADGADGADADAGGVPDMIPEGAPGAPIVARTFPPPRAVADAPADAALAAAAAAAAAARPPAPADEARVLAWFSGAGNVVSGDPVPVVGLVPLAPTAPVAGGDTASTGPIAGAADPTRSDGASLAAVPVGSSVVRSTPPWPDTSTAPAPATEPDPAAGPQAVASAARATGVDPFDPSQLEAGGFAAILGAMHGMVERCGDDNRIREDALKAFRAAYPVLDLERRDVDAAVPTAERERVDGRFARQAAALKARDQVNCDYVRLQTIAWADLATDLRRMSRDSATQYRAGLLTEVQRGAGLGGF